MLDEGKIQRWVENLILLEEIMRQEQVGNKYKDIETEIKEFMKKYFLDDFE